MATPTQAFFLPTAAGQRFCLFHPAQGALVRGQVLYIHPLAEEMNKARRMAALQARALSQAGFNVLQIDLLGCGDSSGDFCDATWHSWVNDVLLAWDYLQHQGRRQSRQDALPLWLWGLRAGCLLAAQAASQSGMACNFVFWQAPSLGQPLLTQFMRLKLAAHLQGELASGVMAQIRQQWAGGEPVEVAGYALSPGLASGLMQAALTPPVPRTPGQRLEWFELSTQETASASVVTTERFAGWQQAGFDARLHRVRGPAFWQTTETEEAPALLSATTAALLACAPPTALEASCP